MTTSLGKTKILQNKNITKQKIVPGYGAIFASEILFVRFMKIKILSFGT